MALIASGAAAEAAELASGPPDLRLDVTLLPPVARPGKILCVGVNYPERNAEYKDASEAPKYPSLFVRFPSSLVGHGTPIVRPPESSQLDYEGEIVLVIGRRGRRIAEPIAHEHVFGLTLMNEGSVRWHGSSNHAKPTVGAIGPWIVPRGELDDLSSPASTARSAAAPARVAMRRSPRSAGPAPRQQYAMIRRDGWYPATWSRSSARRSACCATPSPTRRFDPMPHLIIEYSANLEADLDIGALCRAIHSAALATG
jgi:hypothetical protein